jgi:hypothetical protein
VTSYPPTKEQKCLSICEEAGATDITKIVLLRKLASVIATINNDT